MKIRCTFNRHRWGSDLYSVDAFLRDWVCGAKTAFFGEIALAFCRDCNAVKYDHVSMSRRPASTTGSEQP